jgi:preprotein translocase subunit SecF
MNNLSVKHLLLIIFVLFLTTGPCEAGFISYFSLKSDGISLSGGFTGKSIYETRQEPKAARRAKKKQEAKERKQKKDYAASVKRSQKRSIEIQTPEVKARMKQNKKDTESKFKSKKKKANSTTRKAGKKYN